MVTDVASVRPVVCLASVSSPNRVRRLTANVSPAKSKPCVPPLSCSLPLVACREAPRLPCGRLLHTAACLHTALVSSLSLTQLTTSGGAASTSHRSVSHCLHTALVSSLSLTAHSFRLFSVSLWLTYETTGNVI